MRVICSVAAVAFHSRQEMKELWPPQSEVDTMSGQASLIILSIASVVYLLSGALMYKLWEDDWSYLDAIYFIFVTTR